MRTFLLLLFLSLAGFLPAHAAAEAPPDTLIVLDRGACEQRCAVYRIVIFADGTVIYEGRHFVRQPGVVRGSISPEDLAKLVAEFDSAGFFQMETNYGYGGKDHCDAWQPGEPSAILTVSGNGRSKTILHNHGCSGSAPSRLTALEDGVDRAVHAGRWIK